MLTYTPASELPPSPQKNQEKPWLLLLLCLFWLLPGLIGHDPWKPQENENVAVIANLLRQSNWVMTWLADRPYLDTAPLYYWTAAIFANALAWFGLAVHDAARLSTGFWMALALWGCGLAGRELFGRRFGRLAVVSILGCLGLVLWGHHIAPAVLAFTGYAWAFYALILALKKPILAGVVLGSSLLMLLLGATWADAALVIVIAAGLLGFAAWRKSCYLVALVTALVIALPLAALWGYALNEYSPALFQLWWRQYAWGPYGGAAAVQWLHEPGFLLSTMVWFAWPVLPLAAWSLWINRNELRSSFAWQPLLWFLCSITLYIVLSGQPTEVIVLPLLIVLGLIAVAGVDDLRRGAASALNSFSILTFGLTAIGIWAAWGVLMWGGETQLFTRLSRHSSSLMQFSPLGFGFALIVTVLWGGVLLRPRAIGRKALTNWSCGLILVMGLFVGLFQDWVDSGKSYRPVAIQLHSVASRVQVHCIDAQGLPSAPLGAMVYFSNYPIKTINPQECEVAIRLRQDPPLLGWTVLAEANRSGENREKFLIYAK